MTRTEKWANKREQLHIEGISEFTTRDYLAHIKRDTERLVELVSKLVPIDEREEEYISIFDDVMENPIEQIDTFFGCKK